MEELVMIKAMLNREVYTKFSKTLTTLESLEKEHKFLLAVLADLYDDTEVSSVSPDDLLVKFRIMFPHEKDNAVVADMITTLSDIDVDPHVLQDTLCYLTERHVCSDIAGLILPVIEGQKTGVMKELSGHIERYTSLTEELIEDEDKDPSTLPLDLLIAKQAEKRGMKWPLTFLQETLGPVVRGSLGHVYAYPETGKTAFATTVLAYFAKQIKNTTHNLLYLGNEEDINLTVLRTVAAFCHKSMVAIEEDEVLRARADEYWAENGGHRIRFRDNIFHAAALTNCIERFQPWVVIVDQGPKVKHWNYKNLSEPAQKQAIYNLYRELAKKHNCAIITLGQADATAEGKKWLKLSQMDGSKVGMPGELDWCLGIGKDENNPGMRYFKTLKNKLTGMVGKIAVVNFDFEQSRYYEPK